MAAPRKIALAVCVIPLAVWGGLHLRNSLECRRLEEDYLDAASMLKGDTLVATARSYRPSPADLEPPYERDLARIGTTLTAIYDRCGTRAGRAAARKGAAILSRGD